MGSSPNHYSYHSYIVPTYYILITLRQYFAYYLVLRGVTGWIWVWVVAGDSTLRYLSPMYSLRSTVGTILHDRPGSSVGSTMNP